jgi:hypothetical protein
LFALSGPMYSSVPEFSTEQNKKTTKRRFRLFRLGSYFAYSPHLVVKCFYT